MKIYLASRYGRLDEMAKRAKELTYLGETITSQWVWGNEEGKSQEEIAEMDLDDVSRADACISFTEPYGSYNLGGGRHFEFGVAYNLDKLCILIGPKEIVFHHLPGVMQYDTWDDFLRDIYWSDPQLTELADLA